MMVYWFFLAQSLYVPSIDIIFSLCTLSHVLKYKSNEPLTPKPPSPSPLSSYPNKTFNHNTPLGTLAPKLPMYTLQPRISYHVIRHATFNPLRYKLKPPNMQQVTQSSTPACPPPPMKPLSPCRVFHSQKGTLKSHSVCQRSSFCENPNDRRLPIVSPDTEL